MKYSIKMAGSAKQMLKEITDRRLQEEIVKRIDKLAEDPNLQGKPLKGILRGTAVFEPPDSVIALYTRWMMRQSLYLLLGPAFAKKAARMIFTRACKNCFKRAA